MKNILSVIIICLTTVLNAQPVSQPPAISQILTISVEVMNFAESEKKINELISETGSVIESSSRDMTYRRYKSSTQKLITNAAGFERFRQELPLLGSVAQNNIQSKNNRDELERLTVELNYLKTQKAAYESEIRDIDKGINKAAYENFWNKARELDERIFNTEKQILKNQQEIRNYVVSITINEFHSEPLESADFEFINMPGFETIYLTLENPKSNVSSSAYVGGGIRYMFSKGKSYVLLSILKSMDSIDPANSEETKDMFMYGYGADFYPRYFGRGQREWLNLYSGFVLGGLYMTSDSSSNHIGFLTPHMGVELYKNQYVLADIRVGYFVPLDETTNLNYRGMTTSFSFNFMF